MAYYVGLDVSVKETSICIMDDKGVVAARTDISTDPDLISNFISKHAPDVERVVHESGILAIWLTRELEKRGVPIICIDARLAHKALSGRINKSDQGDAEGLAQLARLSCIAGQCTRGRRLQAIAERRVGSLRSISAARHRSACAFSLVPASG